VKKLIALAALALVAFAASCDTENVGNDPRFFTVNITGITPADPAGLFGSEGFTATAAVTGGSAPYTYSWDFGGASTPSPSVSPAGATTMITQTFVALAAQTNFTISVTATDGNGVTSTATQQITVGATRNILPTIDSAVYDAAARTLTVTVSDTDNGETLTVAATPSAGLAVDAATKVAAATGPLTAVFNVTATDFIAGATGTIAVSVTDSHGGVTNLAQDVAVNIPAVTVPADTLVALPTSGSAATGADVQVIIITGVPANPFQYMVGAGLTIESDATYVANSFDVGAADATPDTGAVNPVDGIWAAMNPGGGFLLAPDNFIQSTDIGGGRERWDFNITPLGGSNLTTDEGVLFNAKFKFSAACTKTFGFQDVSGVKRTYYADDAAEYFWGNIANDGSVGPNSVTIN
jgi:hypothetical protein